LATRKHNGATYCPIVIAIVHRAPAKFYRYVCAGAGASASTAALGAHARAPHAALSTQGASYKGNGDATSHNIYNPVKSTAELQRLTKRHDQWWRSAALYRVLTIVIRSTNRINDTYTRHVLFQVHAALSYTQN